MEVELLQLAWLKPEEVSSSAGKIHCISPDAPILLRNGKSVRLSYLNTNAPQIGATKKPWVRPHNPRVSDPPTLHPTLSSWLRNMNILSTLIDRLHDLATNAPQDHQAQLKRQVIALRTAFKKQQERCIAFLHLTGEYADRYLEDIAEEIQRQSSFLDALERRLDMAKICVNKSIICESLTRTGHWIA
jgi:hypothetical protein